MASGEGKLKCMIVKSEQLISMEDARDEPKARRDSIR